ncbi:MAG: hypothetical protein K5892_06000 [Acholeplasmatales bacterium]|nr:hypothetical protein [Acholeplasmatales bacterium]
MSDTLKKIMYIFLIVALFIGAWLWADVFNLEEVLNIENNIIRLIGCILTLTSIFTFIFLSGVMHLSSGLWGIKNIIFNIFSILGTIMLCVCIFSFFCYIDIVPGMPQNETMRMIYGYLALSLMIGGGASSGVCIIIIII